MFAYITVGKFDSIDTERMIPLKQFVWKELDRNLSESYKKEISSVYDSLENSMFEYKATMLALHCTKLPEIRWKKKMAEYYRNHGKDPDEILSFYDDVKRLPPKPTKFYKKANIRLLWEKVQPWYDQAIDKYGKIVFTSIRKALDYLKYPESDLIKEINEIRIIPNLIGPQGSAMGPTWCGIKYDIHTPWNRISYTPHEFILMYNE